MTREDEFDALFREGHVAILHYLQRRVAAEDAADIAAEVFLVAWRRIDAIPDDAPLLWLYGVAHRALANHRRGLRRRDRLAAELGAALRAATPADEPPASVVLVREALAALPFADRELLTLSVWEGLTAAEIARVVGSTAGAVRVRLHRARRRLRDAVDGPPDGAIVATAARSVAARPATAPAPGTPCRDG